MVEGSTSPSRPRSVGLSPDGNRLQSLIPSRGGVRAEAHLSHREARGEDRLADFKSAWMTCGRIATHGRRGATSRPVHALSPHVTVPLASPHRMMALFHGI